MAKIYPFAPEDDLTDKEWEQLAVKIPERLHYFVEKNKVTPGDYLKTKEQNYRNTPFLQVYGHANEHT